MPSDCNPKADDPTVALHTDELSVSRRQVAGDTVRVSIVPREHERPVDEELTHQRVEVERVPIGRLIDAVPPVREEGDTTIMSVVEEVIAIERRLILKEEVRIRRVRVNEAHRDTVTVRKQDVVITRIPPEQPTVEEGPPAPRD
jgi:stress response protein YsnF